MITTVPKAVKLWGRGQLTIPKELREALKLEEEAQMTAFVVGSCLVLTPKKLQRPSLAKATEASMKGQELSLKDVLSSLEKERERYNKGHYGL